MNTAEKRVQLETVGEPWPECHGQPMSWNRDTRKAAGGFFKCRVENRKWASQLREARRQSGLCIYCGRPAVAGTRCRECADRHADLMATPKQRLQHQFASIRYRRKQREDFRPTGSGRAAFAAWLENLTGR